MFSDELKQLVVNGLAKHSPLDLGSLRRVFKPHDVSNAAQITNHQILWNLPASTHENDERHSNTVITVIDGTIFTVLSSWHRESSPFEECTKALGSHQPLLIIYLLMVYTQVMSFTITVKNRKCGKVMFHCRKARPYRADLSLFLNVPVVTVKSEMTVWHTRRVFFFLHRAKDELPPFSPLFSLLPFPPLLVLPPQSRPLRSRAP